MGIWCRHKNPRENNQRCEEPFKFQISVNCLKSHPLFVLKKNFLCTFFFNQSNIYIQEKTSITNAGWIPRTFREGPHQNRGQALISISQVPYLLQRKAGLLASVSVPCIHSTCLWGHTWQWWDWLVVSQAQLASFTRCCLCEIHLYREPLHSLSSLRGLSPYEWLSHQPFILLLVVCLC